MSGARTFRVRLLRALALDGRRHLAGAEVELAADDAAEAIRAGWARLVDPDDIGALAYAAKATDAGAWAQPVYTRH